MTELDLNNVSIKEIEKYTVPVYTQVPDQDVFSNVGRAVILPDADASVGYRVWALSMKTLENPASNMGAWLIDELKRNYDGQVPVEKEQFEYLLASMKDFAEKNPGKPSDVAVDIQDVGPSETVDLNSGQRLINSQVTKAGLIGFLSFKGEDTPDRALGVIYSPVLDEYKIKG